MAARALLLALAAALLATFAAPLLPGMYAWGISLPRYLPDPLAAGSVVVPAAALVAAIRASRSATRGARARATRSAGASRPRAAAEATAGAFGRTDLAAALGFGLLAAALCWSLPDRTRFTGDFLLRLGSISLPDDPRLAMGQATPLDLAIFVELPRALMRATGMPADAAARALGLFLALLFGASAWAFSRALRLPPGPTIAIALLVTLQPALALFAGYSKALAAMPLLLLGTVAAALNAARGGRGLLIVGGLTALAPAFHRSGLALLPLWAALLALRFRDREGRPAGAALWVATLLPIAALGWCLPGMLETMRRFDGPHFAAAGAPAAAIARRIFSGAWTDRANLLLTVAPLAVLALPLAIALGSAPWRRRDGRLLMAAVVPQLVLLLAVQPKQGLFRDWDVFAAAGTAVTLVAAWMVAEISRARAGTALAFAAAVAGAMPAVGWLAHWNDRSLASRRIEAWLAGPPAPDPSSAAGAWRFVALRAVEAERWDEAMNAYRHSVEAAPNPRGFAEWGMAEALRGDVASARALYLEAVELDSNLTIGWQGLAAAASQLGDIPALERARARLRLLTPDGAQLPEIEAYLERNRLLYAPAAGAAESAPLTAGREPRRNPRGRTAALTPGRTPGSRENSALRGHGWRGDYLAPGGAAIDPYSGP